MYMYILYRHARTCIVTGYSSSSSPTATKLLADVLDTDHELAASPHATQQLDSYAGTHDTPNSTAGGEDSLQDANINMESFKVAAVSRNPTRDSGYGGSELKRTISINGVLTADRHNDSGVQLAPSADRLTQNLEHDGEEGDQSSHDLLPVFSTTTLPPKTSPNTEQFTLGTMTLGARKLLDSDQCSDDHLPTDDLAYPSQKNFSSSIKHELTAHQCRDPQDSNPLFIYPPESLVVIGVHAPLLALSENCATYVHGSFVMPVRRERDPLYGAPVQKYFQGLAGDYT